MSAIHLLNTFGRLTSLVTFAPNSHPAPRGLTDHVSMSSGSDHIRSEAQRISDQLSHRVPF
jgi:hypothetical protein